MINQSFKIFEAIKNGNLFLRWNWRHLLKMSLFPLTVHVISAIFIQLNKADASVFELYLWNLPAVSALGWFTFIQTRLIFLGETLHNIPEDDWYRFERKQSMQASVIIFILFNMVITFAATAMMLLALADNANKLPHSTASFLSLIIVAVLFFGVRYAFLYILAAVRFPLKIFIQTIVRPLVSVQIIATVSMVFLPIMVVSQGLFFAIAPSNEALLSGIGLGTNEKITIAVLSSIISLLTTSLVNIVLTYAVRQMIFPFNREV